MTIWPSFFLWRLAHAQQFVLIWLPGNIPFQWEHVFCLLQLVRRFVFVFGLRNLWQICTFILRSHHTQGWWNTSCKSLWLLRGPQTKKYMLDVDAMAKGPSDVSILLIDEHIIGSLKTIYGSTLPRWWDPVSGRLPSKLSCSKGLRLETTTRWCISDVKLLRNRNMNWRNRCYRTCPYHGIEKIQQKTLIPTRRLSVARSELLVAPEHLRWAEFSFYRCKDYQEVDIEIGGCRCFPWGHRRAEAHVADHVA